LTVRTQEETVALHVTPGAGSEHRRDGHVRSRRLARADVELRELELLDDVASLSRGCDWPGWQARFRRCGHPPRAPPCGQIPRVRLPLGGDREVRRWLGDVTALDAVIRSGKGA